MAEPEPWDDARMREGFIYDGGEAEFHDPIHGAQTQRRVAGEIWDRWQKAHDERVRSEIGYEYRVQHPVYTEGLKDWAGWTKYRHLAEEGARNWGPEAWIERRIVGPIERVEDYPMNAQDTAQQIQTHDRVYTPDHEPGTAPGWVRQTRIKTDGVIVEVILGPKDWRWYHAEELWLAKAPSEAVRTALQVYGEHEWSPTTQLCGCGAFFPALGTNGHSEHRMSMVVSALAERGLA